MCHDTKDDLPDHDHFAARPAARHAPSEHGLMSGGVISPLLVTAAILAVATVGSADPLHAQDESYSGTGDDVVRIDKPKADRPALLVIDGNREGRHFSVIGYTANRERTGVLVNTTDSYSGIVPLDLPPTENTAFLEVSASGSWAIDLYPIGAAQTVDVPGSFDGEGDRVLWVEGEPSTAEIRGNQNQRHFSVIAYDQYGNRQKVLVNTTDPYDGTVLMPRDVLLLEVSASGSWTIRLEGEGASTGKADTKVTEYGDWKFVVPNDAEPGENRSDARIDEESGDGTYSLSLSCSANDLAFTFIFVEDSNLLLRLSQAGEAQVTWQVDEGQQRAFRANASGPVTASGDMIRQFADQVATGHELSLQITPTGQEKPGITKTFSLDGSSRALRRLPCYP